MCGQQDAGLAGGAEVRVDIVSGRAGRYGDALDGPAEGSEMGLEEDADGEFEFRGADYGHERFEKCDYGVGHLRGGGRGGHSCFFFLRKRLWDLWRWGGSGFKLHGPVSDYFLMFYTAAIPGWWPNRSPTGSPLHVTHVSLIPLPVEPDTTGCLA